MIKNKKWSGNTACWKAKLPDYEHEKGRCDSYYRWNIRNYNIKVLKAYWKPWNWDQNRIYLEISLFRNSSVKCRKEQKGTIRLSTQERILLWGLWHLLDVCRAKARDIKTSALWEITWNIILAIIIIIIIITIIIVIIIIIIISFRLIKTKFIRHIQCFFLLN